MKRLILCALTFAVLSAGAQTRKKIDFDNDWKFAPGHAADPSKDFNYTIANIFAKSGKAEQTAIDPKFDDKAWRDVTLPHDWVVALPFEKSPNVDVMAHGYKPVGGLYPQNSIGWYRKHFTIHKADSGQRFTVQFDGIFRDAEIWCNGFYLGNNKSGYLGISYDITDYINYKKENVLTVRVDASQYEGWFYEGAGIYRHVWLNKFPNIHIGENGIFASSFVRENEAYITVSTTLSNKHLGEDSEEVTVYCYVTDRNGKKIAESAQNKIQIKAQQTRTETQLMSIQNAHLWSLEDPYLYKVFSVIKSGDKILDIQKIRFGIRTIRIDPGRGLFLNEKHVKIQGVNCHQDHAGVGSAMPDRLQYYRIELLKEMGVNAYRASHNAPTPELLDACDSLGMLVMDEQRLLNSSPEYMDQLERLIKRDRNHPSVFLWSIGNEEQGIQANSFGKRIAQTLLTKQLELDPGRISTYAADLGNVFNGVNEVIPVRGFNYRINSIDDYHREHEWQPVIGTEMGSTVTTRGIYKVDSVNAYVPDQDITYPWWASSAEQWWTIAADRPWFMGGFVWTGFDYRGEPTPFEWPNINSHFGIMDMCGFPKNIYYYYQSWWRADKDVIHISPHWSWKGKEGDTIKVWVNSNAETVELFLNKKSLGKKEMPRNRHVAWDVQYAPGTLEAVGYRNGRKMTTRQVTTDQAYSIHLVADRTTIDADGKDISVINVIVRDKKGREVPDASNLIEFSLNGNGKILGVGNGDPSSHEPDQYTDEKYKRKLFNGKCQLIVQSGTVSGPLEVVAVSNGLISGKQIIQLK
jgi:beta-galactosidase